MKKAFVLGGAAALLLACGGRIQPASGDGDPGSGQDQGGAAGGGASGAAASGGGASGGAFGGGGSSGGGQGSTGGTTGTVDPATGLSLGQCMLGMTGAAHAFPPTVGSADGILGAGARVQSVYCNVTSGDTYRLVLLPTRDPEVPVTRDAQATLQHYTGDCSCPTCDCVMDTVGPVSCSVMPYKDDSSHYDASFDCLLPTGEDLPPSHLSGAVHITPIPDTLAAPPSHRSSTEAPALRRRAWSLR